MTSGVLCSTWFIIYINQFLVLNLDGWFGVSSNIHYFLIFHYYTINLSQIINNFLSFFLFLLLFHYQILYFSFNFFWTILWWSSWDFRNFISDFITHQTTSCIYCFLNWSFWSSSKCLCWRLFSMIKKFLAVFTI